MKLDQVKTRSAPFISTISHRDNWLRSRLWDAQRFGITPGTARRRIQSDAPAVLLATMPKSGTHLLERAVCLRPPFYRRILPTIHRNNLSGFGSIDDILARTGSGQVLVSHLPHDTVLAESTSERGTRVVALVRDPRAVLVSSIMHISARSEHPMHNAMEAVSNFEDRVRLRIEAAEEYGMLSIPRQLASYASWAGSGALVLRFEDLIGLRGGGSADAQQQTLQDLFLHLDRPADQLEIERIGGNLFSGASPTFRTGQIEGWREHLSGRTAELVNDAFEAELAALGHDGLLRTLKYDS